MKRSLMLLPLLLAFATQAQADTGFVIHSENLSAYGSGTTAQLAQEGSAIFHVNSVPLPTYTVPGSLGGDLTTGPSWSQFEADFSSVLLGVGGNRFDIGLVNVNGDDSRNNFSHVVELRLNALAKPLTLFDLADVGKGVQGSTTINLTLRQIDPQLADDIAELQDTINKFDDNAVAQATDAKTLAHQLDELGQLENDLNDLIDRGFDNLHDADIDALAAKYPDIGADVAAALDQLLDDLHKSLAQYRQEVAAIISTFQGQVAQVTDAIVTSAARNGGFDPTDPGNYKPQGDPTTIPGVTVPQVGSDPFDPTHDPYGPYADQIMAKLNGYTKLGAVSDRASFENLVSAWRENQNVLTRSLSLRAGTSQAEWGAFLDAQNRVLAVVRKYMTDDGWFIDSPVPESTKQLVDGLLTLRMAAQARELKGNLNLWVGPQPTEEQQMVIDTINAVISGPVGSIDVIVAAQPSDQIQLTNIVNGAIVVAAEVAKFAVYVSPVGPFVLVCEAATGHRLCLPGPPTMSRGERVFSAAALIVSAPFLKMLGKSLSGIGMVACGDAEEVARVYKATTLGANGMTQIGPNLYKSAGGLLYGADPLLGNRIVHVLLHKYPAAYKGTQSIFSVASEEIVPLLDEAFAKGGTAVDGDPGAFIYDMGQKTVGTLGETHIFMVFKPGTTQVVTAFPFFPSVASLPKLVVPARRLAPAGQSSHPSVYSWLMSPGFWPRGQSVSVAHSIVTTPRLVSNRIQV